MFLPLYCTPNTWNRSFCSHRKALVQKQHIKQDWFSSWKYQISAYNAQLHFSETAKLKKSHRPDRSLTHHDGCDKSTTLLPEMPSNRMRQSMNNNKSNLDRTVCCKCMCWNNWHMHRWKPPTSINFCASSFFRQYVLYPISVKLGLTVF